VTTRTNSACRHSPCPQLLDAEVPGISAGASNVVGYQHGGFNDQATNESPAPPNDMNVACVPACDSQQQNTADLGHHEQSIQCSVSSATLAVPKFKPRGKPNPSGGLARKMANGRGHVNVSASRFGRLLREYCSVKRPMHRP
jgi:hypothetical protein